MNRIVLSLPRYSALYSGDSILPSTLLSTLFFCPHLQLSDLCFKIMHSIFLCMFLWTIGGLSKISDSCSFVDDKSKTRTGTCQTKTECLGFGLAAISLNAAGDKLCAGDDDTIQCCVDIKCGEHQCRNNVQDNPCATGTYLTNSRNQIYCPSPSPDDNIQCCVSKNTHLEMRSPQEYESWGFDKFNPLDNIEGLDNWDLSYDYTPPIELAQIPGDIEMNSPAEDNKAYQKWNMDTIPAVQNLEPEYEEYQPLKTLKGKHSSSYLPIDDFNNRIAPSLTVAKDRGQEDEWKQQADHEPTFTDGPNGGPGIDAGDGGHIVFNTQYGGPQMVWNIITP